MTKFGKAPLTLLIIFFGVTFWMIAWMFIAFFVEGWLVAAGLGENKFPKSLPQLLVSLHLTPILISGWFGYLQSNSSWKEFFRYALISLLILFLEISILLHFGLFRIDQYHFLILLRCC